MAASLPSPQLKRIQLKRTQLKLKRNQLKRTQLQRQELEMVGGQSAAAPGLTSTQLKQQGRLGTMLGTAVALRGPRPQVEGGGVVLITRMSPPHRNISLLSRCQQLSRFQLSRMQLRHCQRHCCQRRRAPQSSSRSRSSRPDSWQRCRCPSP